jgi:hypothetical protein
VEIKRKRRNAVDSKKRASGCRLTMITIPVNPRIFHFLLLSLLLVSGRAFSVDPSVTDLVAAYPNQFAAIEGDELVWQDGTRMAISDGVTGKDFLTLLDYPDIDDMFVMSYHPGPSAVPRLNEDPGRVRYEALFEKMYGDCRKGEVEPKMRKVAWLKGTVRFTTINGAADHLEEVVADLKKLPPVMTAYLVPSAGTYNCRDIAGSNRMSMHAYGAAIDISTKYADYWQRTKPVGGVYQYKNRIPFEIVAAFEHHGFIWGGKWYHYDTMHFEYRPELLPRRSR